MCHPTQGNGWENVKERRESKRSADLVAVGAVATVPVCTAHLLHVVEALSPVRDTLARVMGSSLLLITGQQIFANCVCGQRR